MIPILKNHSNNQVIYTPPPPQVVSGLAEADWILRSTGPGVTYAQAWLNPNKASYTTTQGNFYTASGNDQASLDTATIDPEPDGLFGNALRIRTPDGHPNNGVAFKTTMNPSWTSNMEKFDGPFYVQVRIKVDQQFLTASTGGGGRKFIMLAHAHVTDPNRGASHPSCELVGVDGNFWGFPQAYYATNFGGGYGDFLDNYAAYDYKIQNAVDNGDHLPDAKRYCLYTTRPAFPGAKKWAVGEYITLLMRVHIVRYGDWPTTHGGPDGPNENTFTCWYAEPGATSYTRIFHKKNFPIGHPDAGYGGINGIHITNYDTGRTGGPGCTMWWKQLIVSRQFIPLPADQIVLPSWVPEPGTRANVSLDTPMSPDPCTLGGGRSCVYSGSDGFHDHAPGDSAPIVAKELGELGSFLYAGGGHASYWGNEVVHYDVEKRQHVLLSQPYTNLHLHPDTRQWTDGSNGQHWIDDTFTTTTTDQPGASHGYDMNVYIPRGVGNVGPKGALFKPILIGTGPAGGGSKMGQRFDVATGKWEMTGSNAARIGYGGTAFSKARRKVYMLEGEGGGGTDLYVCDLDSLNWSWKTIQMSKNIAFNFYGNFRYIEEMDLLMWYRRYQGQYRFDLEFHLIDPDTGKVYQPGTTGVEIAEPGVTGGGEWVDELGAYFWYSGQETDNVYKLTPPHNPTVNPWVWSVETISGPFPAGFTFNRGMKIYGSFRWFPKLRSFLYFGDMKVPVQAWRVRGT